MEFLFSQHTIQKGRGIGMVEFRLARSTELLQVFSVINQVFRSKYDPTMQLEFPLLFDLKNLARVFVAVEEGRVVSHLAYQRTDYLSEGRRVCVGFLGAVATLPEHRGSGIASRLLEMAEEAMHQEGVDLCLISGNRPLYLRQGYEERGVTYEYPLTAQNKSPEVRVRVYTEADLDTVLELYAGEQKLFRREPEDFRRLLDVNPTLKAQGPRSIPISQIGPTFLVYDQETPIAYFILRGSEKYPIEYAGDRLGVLRGLQTLITETGRPSFIWVPQSDDVMLRLLEREGYQIQTRYHFPPYFTAKVLNAAACDENVWLGMPLPGINYV
jgi:predicted N-acetyltransferase YhbS